MRNSLAMFLACFVGLLLGFLWSDRSVVFEPTLLSLEKEKEEPVTQPPPKKVSVKVTIERTPERISKVSRKKKPTIISRVYRVDKSGIYISCGQGSLAILELMGTSGKRLTAEQYLCGNTIELFSQFDR